MSMFFHVFHVMLFHILLQFFHVSLSGSPKEAIIGSVPNRHDIQSLNLESVGNIKSWRNKDFGGKTGATKKSIGEWISSWWLKPPTRKKNVGNKLDSISKKRIGVNIRNIETTSWMSICSNLCLLECFLYNKSGKNNKVLVYLGLTWKILKKYFFQHQLSFEGVFWHRSMLFIISTQSTPTSDRLPLALLITPLHGGLCFRLAGRL